MNKKLILIITALLAMVGGAKAEVLIDEVNFPDPKFREFLMSQNYGLDGVITDDEINRIDRISVSGKGIKSLKGVEFFKNISTLDCASNELTELDVSKNTKLFELSCGFNKLRTIDTSKNKELVYFFCGSNLITHLDVSQNDRLTEFYCFKNQLEEIDVSHNPNLLSLGCFENQLEEIDVSQNLYLQQLLCYDNRIKAIDLSNNWLLNNLVCYHNDIYGKKMDALIASLPMPDLEVETSFYVIHNMLESNYMTVKQVEAAKAAGWTPLWRVGNDWEPYPGNEYEKGDVNKDGNINSADVQKIYQIMAIGAVTTYPEADLNGDGNINSADIQKVYAIMAGGGDDSHAPAGAVAVDLGLPSGTKWANMNVGAEKPEDYGLYFAWGETRGYTWDTGDGRSFDWASYKWMNEGQPSWQQINKYQVADGQTDACWYDSNGNFIGDGQATLLPEDDAARANWGGQWLMPTCDEIRELYDNTTSKWTIVNGINGRKFTSKTNGNSIFLPAAGYRRDASLDLQPTNGSYWSASVDPTDSSFARYLYFYSGYRSWDGDDRSCGQSVRPVLRK